MAGRERDGIRCIVIRVLVPLTHVFEERMKCSHSGHEEGSYLLRCSRGSPRLIVSVVIGKYDGSVHLPRLFERKGRCLDANIRVTILSKHRTRDQDLLSTDR